MRSVTDRRTEPEPSRETVLLALLKEEEKAKQRTQQVTIDEDVRTSAPAASFISRAIDLEELRCVLGPFSNEGVLTFLQGHTLAKETRSSR